MLNLKRGDAPLEKMFKLFIKDYNNTKSPLVRKRYGIFGSICGLAANFVLFLTKFTVGAYSKSVSVTADAFNNLSDMGSSVITLFGVTISEKPSDKDHPFGHGRIEYIAGLFVAFIILMMGLNFLRESIHKIFSPRPVSFSLPMVLILLPTIPVKLWLSRLNMKIGTKTGLAAMKAVSADSLNDVIATSATIVSAVISLTTTLPIDGYLGVLVSLFVLYSGISIVKDTLSPLLGQAPSSELTEELCAQILKEEAILGVHDLIIHNYGPQKYIASVHAEVPANASLVKIHDVIDNIEREIYSEMGIIIAIHIDPLELDDELTNKMRAAVCRVLLDIHPKLGMHDFRIVLGEAENKLIFDVTVPHTLKESNEYLELEITKRIQKLGNKYTAIITFDRNYI